MFHIDANETVSYPLITSTELEATKGSCLRELQLELHGLASIGAMLGYHQISTLAGQGEKWCGDHLRGDKPIPFALLLLIEELDAELVSMGKQRRQVA